MTHLPGKFVWFECITTDARKAQAFYGEVLGWKVESAPMGDFTYDMIKAGDTTFGGYGQAQGGAPPHWIGYLSVDDVDAAAKKVVALGGKITDKPSDIPTVGRMARVTDSLGARFNLFHSEQDDPADDPAAPVQWMEMTTADEAKSLAFYQKLLGYEDKAMDMGPGGTYHMLQKGSVPRAGLMKSPQPEIPTTWTPYFKTDGCDAAVDRAKRSGGKIAMPGTDIPNIGRFAVIVNPLGAAFGILQPAPR